MPVTDKSMILRGKVFLRNRSTTQGAIAVGNTINFAVTAEESQIRQDDYTTSAGAARNIIDEVDSLGISFTLTDMNPANLSRALRGNDTTFVGGAQTDESIAAPATLDADSLVLTTLPIDTGETVTVTSDPAGTTYTEGTDYEIENGGIVILAAGSISASDALLISYTALASIRVEAVVGQQPEYEVILLGLNKAQADSPVKFTGYKAKLALPPDFALITDEFAQLEVEGELLADTTITDSSDSQFYRMDIV